jgi:hypothetical protein
MQKLPDALVVRFYKIFDNHRQLTKFLLNRCFQVLLMMCIISYYDTVIILIHDTTSVILRTHL